MGRRHHSHNCKIFIWENLLKEVRCFCQLHSHRIVRLLGIGWQGSVAIKIVLPNKTGVARRRFNPPIYSPRGPLFFLPPSHVKPAVSRCTFANKQSLSRAIFTSQILLSRLIHNTLRWTLRTPNFIYSEWPHNESLRDCWDFDMMEERIRRGAGCFFSLKLDGIWLHTLK